MKIPKYNISNSLMRGYDEYTFGNSCGRLLELTSIRKKVELEKDVFTQGNFFEYLATAAVPRSGIPVPRFLKSATPEVEELFTKTAIPTLNMAENEVPKELMEASKFLAVEYRTAVLQAAAFREAYTHMGFKNATTGKVYQHETENGANLKGVLDVECLTLFGSEAIIDLKLTSTMSSKWTPHSWHPENVAKDDILLRQAVAYVFLWAVSRKKDPIEVVRNEEVQFYFYVASSKKLSDRAMWEIVVSPNRMEEFMGLSSSKFMSAPDFYKSNIDAELMSGGLTPISDPMHCMECPAATICDGYRTIPAIKTIHI